MPTLDTLSEADIQKTVNATSLRKSRGYLATIGKASRSGETLTAEVRGSRLYEVEIAVDEGGIHARCTCPYSWGGFCKHIGAVLLKWLQAKGSFTTLPAPPAGTKPGLELMSVAPPKTHRPKEEPLWRTMPFPARQQRERQHLEEWLEQHRLADLRDLGRLNQWPLKGTTKGVIANQLAERLTDPQDIQKLVNGLDDDHRHVFQAVVLLERGLYHRPEDIERVARGLGLSGQHKKIDAYTHHLTEKGLVFAAGASFDFWAAIPFVPSALVRALPPIFANLPAAPASQADSQLLLADAATPTRTITQLLLLIEQGSYSLRPPQPRPRLEKFYRGLADWRYDPEELLRAKEKGQFQGGPQAHNLTLAVPPPEPALPDETSQRLAPLAGDAGRLDFYYHLLVAAGIFQPGSPVTVWPDVKNHFLRLDEAAQWATLARVFFELESWSEFWELIRATPGLQLHRTVASNLTPKLLDEALLRGRRLVLRLLACLPDDRWLAFEELDRLLRPLWPRFEATGSPSSYFGPTNSTWHIASGSRRLIPEQDRAAWDLLQGQFARRLISGPLRWLGLADVRLESGRLAAFRLHSLGDLYWDRVAVPEPTLLPATQPAAGRKPTPEKAVQVEAGRIILDPAAITAQAHSFLDHIARLEETQPGRFVYQVQAKAIHAAFEEGLTLAQLEEQWQEHLGAPMPDSLQTMLAGWWQQYGRVRLYENVTIIEFSDDYALAEMKAVTSLEQRLIAQLSPRLVLVTPEAVSILTAELQQSGYTPKVTDEAS